jgi:hypothetical protein
MKRFALPITLFFIAGCAMIILRVPGLLDSRIYYSAEEARLFLTQLSPHMAQTYFWHCLWDFLFMFSYTWLLWLRLATPWALLPGMIDIGETSLILMALKTGDAPYTLMSLFTLGKWAGFVLHAERTLSRVHVNRKKN